MPKKYISYIDGSNIYVCKKCETHLVPLRELISKAYRGRTGTAYLFNDVQNILHGKQRQQNMLSGLHKVCSIYCWTCDDDEPIGWKYIKAYEQSQKFKQSKYIIERHFLTVYNWDQELDEEIETYQNQGQYTNKLIFIFTELLNQLQLINTILQNSQNSINYLNEMLVLESVSIKKTILKCTKDMSQIYTVLKYEDQSYVSPIQSLNSNYNWILRPENTIKIKLNKILIIEVWDYEKISLIQDLKVKIKDIVSLRQQNGFSQFIKPSMIFNLCVNYAQSSSTGSKPYTSLIKLKRQVNRSQSKTTRNTSNSIQSIEKKFKDLKPKPKL